MMLGGGHEAPRDHLLLLLCHGGRLQKLASLARRPQKFAERGATVAPYQLWGERVHEGYQQCGGGIAQVAETEAVGMAEEIQF